MTLKNKSKLPEAFMEYCELMTLNGYHLKKLILDDEAFYKLSTAKLNQENCVVQPLKGLNPGVGAIVFRQKSDHQAGQVVVVADSNDYFIRLCKWNKYGATVDIPGWPQPAQNQPAQHQLAH